MKNGLINFDVKANQFSLNMAKLVLGHDPDPVGFHLDFGFGRAKSFTVVSRKTGSTSCAISSRLTSL